MIHQTVIGILDRRQGDVYLKFGTCGDAGSTVGKTRFALGLDLDCGTVLTPIRSVLIMSKAEAIRLSDEIRRLASEIKD